MPAGYSKVSGLQESILRLAAGSEGEDSLLHFDGGAGSHEYVKEEALLEIADEMDGIAGRVEGLEEQRAKDNERLLRLELQDHTPENLGPSMERLERALAELSASMGQMENHLEESLTREFQQVSLELDQVNRPVVDQCQRMTYSLAGELKSLRESMVLATDKAATVQKTVAGLAEKLESKAEKKTVAAVYQKLSNMFIVGVADLMATAMVLVMVVFALTR